MIDLITGGTLSFIEVPFTNLSYVLQFYGVMLLNYTSFYNVSNWTLLLSEAFLIITCIFESTLDSFYITYPSAGILFSAGPIIYNAIWSLIYLDTILYTYES